MGASNWSALATKIGAGTNPKAKKRRAERLAAEEAAREGRGEGRFVRDGGDEKGPHRGSPHGSRLADGLDGMPQKKPAPVGRNTALTDAVALDCEMVGCGEDGKRSVLARVSVVNEDGNVVLDTFVAPGERVVDYRTRVSGVRPADLRDAPPFKEIQRKMADILRGRTLIGHALKNDLKCLLLDHPKSMTRDTALYRPLTRPLRADERARISGAARGRGAARCGSCAKSTSGWRSRRASTRPWTTPGRRCCCTASARWRGSASCGRRAFILRRNGGILIKRARREARNDTRIVKTRGGERREAKRHPPTTTTTTNARRVVARIRSGSGESAWTCSADDNDRRRVVPPQRKTRATLSETPHTGHVT